MTTLQAPVERHELAAPTADDFRRALRAVVGYAATEVWEQVCGRARLDLECSVLTGPQMTAVAAAICERPGRVGLLGRDLGAKVATYRALAETTDAQRAPLEAVDPRVGVLAGARDQTC